MSDAGPVLGLALAFLSGSIPFGYLLGRALGVRDVRRLGSGNIGATNVLRSVGRAAGALTLLLDVLKGTVGAVVAGLTGPEPVPGQLLAWGSLYHTAALVLPVAGHCYSPWLAFRGGKGVATGLGVILAAWPPAAPVALAVFAAATAVTRRVSPGSMAASAAVPVLLAVWRPDGGVHLPAGLLLALLIILRHRENLRRLVRGTEPRLDPASGRGERDP